MAGTVTVGGTVATDGLLLVKVTETAEVAAPFRVTMAVEDAPPKTVEGLSDSDETTEPGGSGGDMVYVYATCPFVPAPERNALTYSTVTCAGVTVTRRWPELGRTLIVYGSVVWYSAKPYP